MEGYKGIENLVPSVTSGFERIQWKRGSIQIQNKWYGISEQFISIVIEASISNINILKKNIETLKNSLKTGKSLNNLLWRANCPGSRNELSLDRCQIFSILSPNRFLSFLSPLLSNKFIILSMSCFSCVNSDYCSF